MAHPPWVVLAAEQRAVGNGRIAVDDHHVGHDALARRGVHGAGPPVGNLDPADPGAVSNRDTMLCSRAGQRTRNGMHATIRKVDTSDAVQIGDHRVDRERLGGGQARVHRLEGEDPAESFVPHKGGNLRRKAPEGAHTHQPQQRCADQLPRRVEIAVDEMRHLYRVQLAQVRDETAVAGRVVDAADLRDLLGHGLGISSHIEDRAVGEPSAIHRIEAMQPQPAAEGLAHGGESRFENVGRGEHGRAGVERIAGSLLDAGPPARTVTLLQNGHHAPGTGQVQGRGQSAEPGTDNDDGVRGAGHGAHPATVAAVVSGTRSSPPLR